MTPGTRLGPYEVSGPLGAGGMGEVYRARDTQLKRDVALKVLPVGFAHDADRLARFQREAELLASLSHQNIASVYGLEKSASVTAIVLELVEGDTLADLLKAQGRLPIDEALAIARQIAAALEAAHERGVIHRDLKPANIKVTPDGKVKVLDFGLAKLIVGETAEAGAANALSNSPTLSVHATYAGTILGTAAYMSPEQARGKPVDRRTDIWSFGCVLYEMLTGRRAFDSGDTVSDAIAAILKADVDLSALPADVPDQIRLLLKRCLEKDRAARIGEVGTARFLMTEAIGGAPKAAAASRNRSALVATIGVIGGAAIAAGIAWWVLQPAPKPAVQPMRFVITTPENLPLAPSPSDRQLVITPDGAHIVYVASDGAAGSSSLQLMVRAVGQLDAVPLRGLSNPRSPFVSPDGKWIAYFDFAAELKKVPITGGPPILICRVTAAPRGGTWGPDDTIVFASNNNAGLQRVPAAGGDPTTLTTVDASRGESNHAFPSFLPGGRALLYTIRPAGALVDNSEIAVLDLQTGKSKILIRGGSQAEYVEVPGGSGQAGLLLYAGAGSLRAVPFDAAKLELAGDPVAVFEQLATARTGAAQYSVSRTGALVYIPGIAIATNAGGGVIRTLAWIDRRGNEELIPAPAREYVSLRLSPDGTTIALDVRDQERDIWTFDLARKTLARLTMDPAIDGYPLWTPDGRRVLFESNRTGPFNVYSQSADGTGVPEALTKSPRHVWPYSISPDGTRMVVHESGASTGDDLDVLVMDGKSQPKPIIQSTFSEQHGEISPDGRWLAYSSDDSGQAQVFVRPFPDVNGGKWQVSTAGGSKPVWSPNGKELFYLSGTAMMAVPIQTTSFSAANPVKLFEGNYFAAGTARVYDVSRDGQKFLMIKEPKADPQTTPASMVMVLNWLEGLKTSSERR